MSPQQVLDEFKSKSEIARVVGVTPASVQEWFEDGEVPEGRQYQLHVATSGRLQADKPADRRLLALPTPKKRGA